jgi:hypothetical protein
VAPTEHLPQAVCIPGWQAPVQQGFFFQRAHGPLLAMSYVGLGWFGYEFGYQPLPAPIVWLRWAACQPLGIGLKWRQEWLHTPFLAEPCNMPCQQLWSVRLAAATVRMA